MKENFLHYVWQYTLFNTESIKTTANEDIIIINSGAHNTNAGPDFLQAKVSINNQLWVGNVEIHLKSSDWYVHHHEQDVNYDAVILHVVWEHDVEVYLSHDRKISTLVLKNLISDDLIKNYTNLYASNLRWIPCENEISSVSRFVKDNWIERLFIERLIDRSVFIDDLLLSSQNNYEAVLFLLLAYIYIYLP